MMKKWNWRKQLTKEEAKVIADYDVAVVKLDALRARMTPLKAQADFIRNRAIQRARYKAKAKSP